MQQNNQNFKDEYREIDTAEIVNLGNANGINSTHKIEIKTVERKTGERFVLAFLTLALFITGLIISLINLTQQTETQRAHLQSHYHPNYTYTQSLQDAGCRYDFNNKCFVFEDR